MNSAARKLDEVISKNAFDEYEMLNFRSKSESMFFAGLDEIVYQKFPEIQRVRNISNDEIKTRFRDTSTPVIIEGLMDNWRALKLWNYDYLKSKIGNVRVRINQYDPEKSRDATFAEFVDLLKQHGDSKDPLYLQEWPYRTEAPFLADDLGKISFQEAYDVRPKIYGASGGGIWFGQKNASTYMHRDGGYFDAVNVSIVGRKKWILCGPDAFAEIDSNGGPNLKKFFENPNVPVLHCTTKPGDVIYVPANWFHRVRLIDDCIGISIATLDEKNIYSHFKAKLQEVVPLALNAEKVKELSMYNAVVARWKSLAKQIGIDLNVFRNNKLK